MTKLCWAGRQWLKKIIRKPLNKMGYDIQRLNELSLINRLADLSPKEQQILLSAIPYTMTSVERMASLINAIRYVVTHKISGDIAECGVWRGGSMMIIAQTLMSMNDTSRKLYLFDTYEGMPAPTFNDKKFDGQSADILLNAEPLQTGIWCYASLEDVRQNLALTNYPKENIIFVKGKVEDSIPKTSPESLALLRLDTDWYESTKHELEHLFPLLSKNGVLIIDDYGHWQGARKAVDEYFGKFPDPVYLNRIDNTGRLIVKH